MWLSPLAQLLVSTGEFFGGREVMVDQEQSVRHGDRCRTLLIEEDDAYRAVIEACVRLAGCRVEVVADLDRAFPEMEHQGFDLVVWGVSDTNENHRREIISELRLRTEAPLILIDCGPEQAQLDLEAGADQWLPKPFVPGALVGSIRAALRKSASSIIDIASKFEVRGMMLDGKRRKLTFGQSQVGFTRQEWELLSILVNYPDRFLGVREIMRLGWRAGDHGPEQLRTYVHRLRQKLDPLGLPCRLLSQHGQGYCLSFH
jgi:DNA-binding response OmpR family regulator